MPPTIDLAVTNDLATDNRVHKMAISLQDMGYAVRLTGRKRRSSPALSPRSYPTRRMRLIFEKGPLFYAEFNIRLLWRLLFSGARIVVANDLDTLPACFVAAKLRRKKLVFDSHEYFTEVPELVKRPKVQAFWKKIERLLVPGVKQAITVCDSIADLYQQEYGVPFRIVRNLPLRTPKVTVAPKKKIDTNEQKVILYQGALNRGRGLEHAIRAMQYTEQAQLWLAGDGDLTAKLQSLVQQLNLGKKVKFLGRIPLHELPGITAQADLGLSIEEDLGLNYRYALPNKLFDYIQQHVPVLVSNLPEMRKVVENYQVGLVLDSHKPHNMARQFEQALYDTDLRNIWLSNLPRAAEELCWECEQPVLYEIFRDLR
ncbi:glycosyltransferase [Gaoshiqia sediminis]|uniref:Glycosyltransferase n=1 Tax=Gaoshiqia sediminis TaxID=2986998 RepID=A0AA41Y8T1_9BACT|nr:glycosyltransferase [Gaoshiqia sediminis]MCW0481433.1 glycosyltransferase [Gaoshiqia sediminis]